MIMNRVWAMPSRDTFDCKPIGAFVQRYLAQSKISIDPFARNKRWATYTNDLNPETLAEYHMDAVDFLIMLADKGIKADLVLLDPPYSQYAVARCYKDIGREYKAFGEDNNCVLYKRVKDACMSILTDDATILTFAWNSTGMGKKRGFAIEDILLVCHGGARNDTICVAEKRTQIRLL